MEVDETYFGGKEGNKHPDKKLNAGRGTVGKTAVVGTKNRKTNEVHAAVIPDTTAETLQGFAKQHVEKGGTLYSDDAGAYENFDHVATHESVRHSVGEYVRKQAHVNGIESFWAMLKRGYTGTFHRLSPKHLQRYVNEFAGRHNVRDRDTIEQMCLLARGLVGKRLRYRDLIAGGSTELPPFEPCPGPVVSWGQHPRQKEPAMTASTGHPDRFEVIAAEILELRKDSNVIREALLKQGDALMLQSEHWRQVRRPSANRRRPLVDS